MRTLRGGELAGFPAPHHRESSCKRQEQAFSSHLSVRAVALASQSPDCEKSASVVQAAGAAQMESLLRPCFSPRLLGDQHRNSGEKVVSGNWGLETMALVRS